MAGLLPRVHDPAHTLPAVRTVSLRNPVKLVVALLGVGVLVAGCADFDASSAPESWTPTPQMQPQAGPQPSIPGADEAGRARPGGQGSESQPRTPIPPPEGCKDFDKAVIATCLDTVSTVATLPSGSGTISVLAGERTTGEVFTVSPKSEKVRIADLDVTAAGGGGLTALAPSPTYREDRLIFAYITTETDNRVVRFAEGQPAEPVLTGIPKGPTHNAGALLVDSSGALLVATGDAGDRTAATDPESLAGKVLRIDTSGAPAQGNPDSASRVIAGGLHAPGGMCEPPQQGSRTEGAPAQDARLWVTDRQADEGAVYLVEPGETLGAPIWTWPDKPGVAGCVEWSGVLSIATSKAGNVQNLTVTKSGAVTGKPQTTFGKDSKRHYGRLAGLDLISPSLAVAGTVNKAGGDPVSSDDRVVLIPRTATPTAGRS